MRIRPSSTQETAKVTRVDGERQPPRHGVQHAAERSADQAGDVLAGLVLAERGRQVARRATTVRTADISAGANSPAPTPVSSATDEQVRDGERAGDAGDDQGGVEQDAGAGRRAASSGAGRPGRRARPRGQQGRRQAEQVEPPRRPAASSAEPVSA